MVESEASGLDSNDVKEAVTKQVERIEAGMEECMQTSLTSLSKHVKTCMKLVTGLDVNNEAEFRKSMGGLASKIATAVQKLKAAAGNVKVAYTTHGLTFAEKHGVLSKEAAEAGAMCMYHVSVYAALNLYRDAATWAKVPAAAKSIASLKQAVGSLSSISADVAALEIKYNHQVVADMRAEIKMPRPSIGEAVVFDQSMVAGSATPVSDELVCAGRSSAGLATPVSDERVCVRVRLARQRRPVERETESERSRSRRPLPIRKRKPPRSPRLRPNGPRLRSRPRALYHHGVVPD